MDAGDRKRRQQAWSRYWSSGRLHSCAAGSGDNYTGAIGAFWHRVFQQVVPTGPVLDLATGNGALPRLLWELRHARADVDAVDLAELAPAWYQPRTHTGIRFHPGVRMEALPFADAVFDCVVSQFGFEYADRSAALAECLRVARPQACIALVMHHAQSVLARVAREELAHHDRLLGRDGLIAAARAILPWLARMKAGQPLHDAQAATVARQHYNAAMRELATAAQASSAPDLLLEAREAVHRLLASQDPQSALPALEAYAEELEGARLRTTELVAHALDRAQLEALVQQLRAARPGWDVDCRELVQAEGVLAWSLLATPGLSHRAAG